MRTHWNGKDVAELRERVAAYAEAGVQHVMVHPLNRDIDDWDEVIEGVGRLVAGYCENLTLGTLCQGPNLTADPEKAFGGRHSRGEALMTTGLRPGG